MNPVMLPDAWDQLILNLPAAHILQTREWGLLKAQYGWRPLSQVWQQPVSSNPVAAALILERAVRFGPVELPLRILYVPRGPLLDWGNSLLRKEVLDRLQDIARKRRAIFIKIDPEVILGTGLPEEKNDLPTGDDVARDLAKRGWVFSAEQIQFRNTMWIDLNLPEEEILARMKPKTRYNLRLAERKGVRIRSGSHEDLALLYSMYAETSARDHFVIREEAYYRAVWGSFMSAGMAEILIAEVEHQPVAAIILFHFGTRAWYLYGMSRAAHREKMPNVLLQWQAICRAKAAGCQIYDLWGAPDEFSEQDSMWGVYRFKEGLGAGVVRTLGAWDYPASQGLYRLYTRTLPAVLGVMRKRGMRDVQNRVQLV